MQSAAHHTSLNIRMLPSGETWYLSGYDEAQRSVFPDQQQLSNSPHVLRRPAYLAGTRRQHYCDGQDERTVERAKKKKKTFFSSGLRCPPRVSATSVSNHFQRAYRTSQKCWYPVATPFVLHALVHSDPKDARAAEEHFNQSQRITLFCS